MKNSNIEWTTHTFNPWIGCTKVSPGCANCYAETLNNRHKWTTWGPAGKRHRTSVTYWNDPVRWNRIAYADRLRYLEKGDALPPRPRVFCASLADWLDADAPSKWRSDLLNLIEATPELDWLLLTKRPESWAVRLAECAAHGHRIAEQWLVGVPPANVWFGVSAENQRYWDARVAIAATIPARVHFVSAEPLLGPIIMGNLRTDWMIVGGESGPGARVMVTPWVESLRVGCAATGTAFFFKQWGGVNKKEHGRELNGATYSEFPTVTA